MTGVRALALLVLLGTLAGCTVGPGYYYNGYGVGAPYYAYPPNFVPWGPEYFVGPYGRGHIYAPGQFVHHPWHGGPPGRPFPSLPHPAAGGFHGGPGFHGRAGFHGGPSGEFHGGH